MKDLVGNEENPPFELRRSIELQALAGGGEAATRWMGCYDNRNRLKGDSHTYGHTRDTSIF